MKTLTLELEDGLHASLTAMIASAGEGAVYPILEAGVAQYNANLKATLVAEVASKYSVVELDTLSKAK